MYSDFCISRYRISFLLLQHEEYISQIKNSFKIYNLFCVALYMVYKDYSQNLSCENIVKRKKYNVNVYLQSATLHNRTNNCNFSTLLNMFECMKFLCIHMGVEGTGVKSCLRASLNLSLYIP